MKKTLSLLTLSLLLTGCATGGHNQGADLGAKWLEQDPANHGEIEVTFNPEGLLASVKLSTTGATEMLASDMSMAKLISMLSKSSLDTIGSDRDGMLGNNNAMSANGVKTAQDIDKMVAAAVKAAIAGMNPATGVPALVTPNQ